MNEWYLKERKGCGERDISLTGTRVPVVGSVVTKKEEGDTTSMIAFAGVNSNDNESSRSSAHHSQSQSESYSESHHQTVATTVMQVQVENFARLYNALHHDRSASDDSVGTSSGRPLCRYCGRSYSSPSNLRQHVKNVHSNWPPQNTWPQCNVCGKRCKTKHYLINHQLQAHGIHQRSNVNSNTSNLNQNQWNSIVSVSRDFPVSHGWFFFSTLLCYCFSWFFFNSIGRGGRW